MPILECAARAFAHLPPKVRERIKRRIGAAGHVGSVFNLLRAKRMASGLKRPDIVLQNTVHTCRAAGFEDLEGKAVLEFGCGYLLAEPLIYTMLGASRVDAVDYACLLCRGAFRTYARRTDWRAVVASSGVGSAGGGFDEWLARLHRALSSGRAEWYRDMGITYMAPFDITCQAAPAGSYDLIVSNSVLEHVPPTLAADVVTKLAAATRPKGAMAHGIHLEDHRDFLSAPFAFLAADSDYREGDYDIRGNRLRSSDWRGLFESVGGFHWTFRESRKSCDLLPVSLDGRFAAYDLDDLRVASVVVLGRRRTDG